MPGVFVGGGGGISRLPPFLPLPTRGMVPRGLGCGRRGGAERGEPSLAPRRSVGAGLGQARAELLGG